MTKKYIRAPYSFAEDLANYPAGASAWSNQPKLITLADSDLNAGFTPDTPVDAPTQNALEKYKADMITVANHAALQTWRRTVIPVTGLTSYSELVGLQPIRTYDTNGDRQRLPVVLGVNSADSNRTYMARSNDGSFWDSAPAEIQPSAGHFPDVLYSVAGQPGAILVAAAASPQIAWSLTHGHTWTQGSVGSFGGTIYGVHYAPGSAKPYYVAHGAGVFSATTPAGLVAATPVLPPMAGGGAAINAAEFADDDGGNVCMIAGSTGTAFPSIYRTTDGGVTWAKVLDMTSTTAPGNISFNRAWGLFVAWDTTGVWVSATGAAWSQVSGSAPVTADMATGYGTFASVGFAIAKIWNLVLQTGDYDQSGIAYSFDLGLTWNTWSFAMIFGSRSNRIRGFNGRLHVIDNLNLWVSGQLGAPRPES